MSGFSPEWLSLREPVDHRSRNGELARAVAARFKGRARISIVDLGCGTGSNLRALAPELAAKQSWTLVDHDPRLLEAAAGKLCTWADAHERSGETLDLRKNGRRIEVAFRQADLAGDPGAVLGGHVDLVTASALFDLFSVGAIERLAQAVAGRRAAFYTVLTYNGVQEWDMALRIDGAMLAAFHAHQRTDKGFGAAAGPDAPALLAGAFSALGYQIVEGDSPWRLERADRDLLEQLAASFWEAVKETGKVPPRDIADWPNAPRTRAVVGHTDTFAVPA